MRRTLPFTLCSLGLLVVASASADTVTYVSQVRTVDASGFAADSQSSDTDAESHTAPGFDPFSEAASATALLSGAIGAGTGSQVSSVSPIAIRTQGSHSANAEGWEEEGIGYAVGVSRFEVEFDLAVSCDYRMDGYLENYDNGHTYLSLTGPGGSVHALDAPSNDQLLVSEAGTLPVGTYTLVVQSSGGASGDFFFYDYASGAYEIDLLFGGAVAAPEVTGARALVVSPNPFRTSTSIAFAASAGEAAHVRIVDVRGRLVTELVRGATTSGTVTWDGRDSSGSGVPSGVYFVRVQSRTGTEIAKVIRRR